MAKLKIKIYPRGQEEPKRVVTIPLGVVRTVSKFVPAKAKTALGKKGIDLNEIASLTENEALRGNIAEIEEKDQRIVIAIE